MTTLDLDADYSASFTPYRHGSGYVAKGTVFRNSKPVDIFEAHGATISAAEDAARAKAEEIVRRRLKAVKREKAKKPCVKQTG